MQQHAAQVFHSSVSDQKILLMADR